MNLPDLQLTNGPMKDVKYKWANRWLDSMENLIGWKEQETEASMCLFLVFLATPLKPLLKRERQHAKCGMSLSPLWRNWDAGNLAALGHMLQTIGQLGYLCMLGHGSGDIV